MNPFTNMHIGRLQFPNQIKFIYILVSPLRPYAPWYLTLERHSPQIRDLERRKRPDTAMMELPMCIRGRHMSDVDHAKENVLLPEKEQGERNA